MNTASTKPHAEESSRSESDELCCDYCGERTRWFDATGSPACRRGRGCARRPAAHSKVITLPSGRVRTVYLLRGDWLGVAALARSANLPLHVVSRRLRRGWNVEDAIAPEVDTLRRRARARGVSERALRLELTAANSTTEGRSKRHPLRAASRGRPARTVRAAGEAHSMHEWAARLGISRTAIYGLAERRGVSVEAVIEQRLRALSANNDDAEPSDD
ncbi:MAG: hypothetical protein U0269_33170 [Polyangiales bacterium]